MPSWQKASRRSLPRLACGQSWRPLARASSPWTSCQLSLHSRLVCTIGEDQSMATVADDEPELESQSARSVPADGRRKIFRHRISTCLWHWINVVAFFMMVMSGLMIFNAHPRLYWENTAPISTLHGLKSRAVTSEAISVSGRRPSIRLACSASRVIRPDTLGRLHFRLGHDPFELQLGRRAPVAPLLRLGACNQPRHLPARQHLESPSSG